MAGFKHSPAAGLIANDIVAVLRHDLITPINLIVGYCDLLTSEAAERGYASRLVPLRSIRNGGYELLRLVDHVLLAETSGQTWERLQELAISLTKPAEGLIQACDALDAEMTSCEESDSFEFRDDLGRIRAAGVRMIEMTAELAEGRIPDDGRAPLPEVS